VITGDRSPSQIFRDLKKNQCAFCKELGHWKVDYSKVKGKNKESKAEANLARVVSTHSSTSQAGGSDSDSSAFSFSVTTLIVGCSGDAEWILDTGATYHVCPNRDWFSSFEKLDDVQLSWVMIAYVTWKVGTV